jgi:large subunit ribosomal protein L19
MIAINGINREVHMTLGQQVLKKKPNANIAKFRSGDTVNVFVKVREGEKERVQLYKGVVTKIQGAGNSKSFTVRKISAGVGVERTFPFASSVVDKVELVSHGEVRRSRLFYLRKRKGKAAKIDSELATPADAVAPTAETAKN